MNQKELSIIIPAYNEEKNIYDAINSVLDCINCRKEKFEIILIDDGSNDKTYQIATSIQDKRIKVIQNKKNLGLAATFIKGVQNSNYQHVVMIPGDNENDVEQIIKYTPLISDFDIIVPFVINKSRRTLCRQIISSLFTYIVNLTFNTKFKYTNGTVIYNRDNLLSMEIKSKSFFFQAEMLIRLVKKNASYVEVPVKLNDKYVSDKSSSIKFKSFINVAKDYLNLVYSIYIKY